MLQVDINTKEIERLAGSQALKQLRFAAAVSLTQTAREARDSIRASMRPPKFTIRRQWVVQGIRYTPASKDTLTATVYSKDPFMGRQETGGTKTGSPSGGNFTGASLQQNKGKRVRPAMGRVAVPTDKVLRSKSEIIRKSELPSGLGERAFVIGKAGETQFLAKRFAKGKRAGLQILYVLKRSTQIKPRLGLREITEKVFTRRFGKIFSEQLAKAIANSNK
jgi:hypothetical protein